MLVWKLGGQIWTYNLFSMSAKQWHTCVKHAAMKQAAKEAFENNMHHHDMKTIAKAEAVECSVQEEVHHICQNWS